MRGSRCWRIGVCLSQVFNVVLLDGRPSEATSSRAYRRGVLDGDPAWDRLRRAIDALFFMDDQHCRRSHLADLQFARELISRSKDHHEDDADEED